MDFSREIHALYGAISESLVVSCMPIIPFRSVALYSCLSFYSYGQVQHIRTSKYCNTLKFAHVLKSMERVSLAIISLHLLPAWKRELRGSGGVCLNTLDRCDVTLEEDNY